MEEQKYEEEDIIKFRKLTMVNGFVYHVKEDFISFTDRHKKLEKERMFMNHKFDINGKCIMTNRETNRHVDTTFYISTSKVLISYTHIVSVEEVELIDKKK